MRFVAALAIAAILLTGCPGIPRDPHPERTPRPSPSADYPLQTGRQPAPSATPAS